MEKRYKEMLSALVKQLRQCLLPLLQDPRAPVEEDATGGEHMAWIWINRLLILRALEVRGLLTGCAGADARQPGHEPLAASLRSPSQMDPAQGMLAGAIAAAGEHAGVARVPSPLFEPQAVTAPAWWEAHWQSRHALATLLPGLFASDPSCPVPESLFLCIELILGKQPVFPGIKPKDLVELFADPDLPGWAYQFYQNEARARINAKCKRGEKVTSRAELVAKTQIFTEEYIVDWLLQNSLGRFYREAYPQSTLAMHWPYAFMPDAGDRPPGRVFSLEELTLLDPCMGCGHFLRVAFDLFVTMYREQSPHMSMVTIVERVFARHVFGIELDPRASQTSALTLLLRSWEWISAERGTPTLHMPAVMHLATVPARLASGSLQRHLQRFPEDEPYQHYLHVIFSGLEQVDILGSLLHLRECLEQATCESPPGSEIAGRLLEHVQASCAAEEGEMGQTSQQAASLLSLLSRRYAVVATNPPYLDSRDMQEALRAYIAEHYQAGKRDLYTAFMLRCLELCQFQGRLALVTMQSWMFNRSFAELRAGAEASATMSQAGEKTFSGLLRTCELEALVHLGAHSFEEITGQIVQCAMFVSLKYPPAQDSRTRTWRLVGLKNVEEKRAALLHPGSQDFLHLQNRPRQSGFLALAEAPLVYYLSEDLMRLLAESKTLHSVAHVRQGLATAENTRFTRCFWEIAPAGSLNRRWFRYARGGSYRKWAGLMWMVVDWEYNGQRIKLGVDARNRPRFRDNAPQFAFQPGLTYTFIASGSFGSRILEKALFDVAGTSLFPRSSAIPLAGLAAVTSSRVVSYLLRVLTQDLKFNPGYVSSLPLPPGIPWSRFQTIGEACIALKKLLVAQDMTEDTFTHAPLTPLYQVQAVLHALEGWNELAVCDLYQLSPQDRQSIIAETGKPAAWYPLLVGYDALPDLSDELEAAFTLPTEFHSYFTAHVRLTPTQDELARIKSRLRLLYAAGPGARKLARAASLETTPANEAGTYLPVPTETFLEELSCAMHLHPISLYWLLEELQAVEDARCLPEERRLLEDRLSVLVLRLLGYRWPEQIAHAEPLPAWAEASGIIPLLPGAAQPALAERVRERWQAEEGLPGALQLEQHLRALTGQELESWLRSSFFERHISQFKQRPIAWHLTSTPLKASFSSQRKSRNQGHSTPAFACLLSYHACTSETLSAIRTQYVEPLMANLRTALETRSAQTPQDVLSLNDACERLHELAEFAARLQWVEEQGFACPELQHFLTVEEGELTCDALTAEERWQREVAWQIDSNDGVRVNIAPLQLAGILAREVLQPQDAHKALADRARWRSEERRWVRAGKLPRCGWSEPAGSIDSWPDQSRHASGADQRAGTGVAQ